MPLRTLVRRSSVNSWILERLLHTKTHALPITTKCRSVILKANGSEPIMELTSTCSGTFSFRGSWEADSEVRAAVEAGVVYTTPNPDLAYRYACPHQLFGNGFLYKVVLDLRVMKDRMYKSFNSKRYNAEEIFFAHDVRVAGFWLFNDTNAAEGDSRILEWDPKFETIPMKVVESWYQQGADIETAMPNVITDPAPKLMPIDNQSWADHVAITSWSDPDIL